MLLAQGLIQHAVPVTLITLTPRDSMDDDKLPFPVVRQPGFVKLFKLLRQAEVIHLAGPSLLPLWLAILLRKPVVIEHHGYQAICPSGLLLYEPTKTVCPGHFMAREYMQCVRCNRPNSGWVKSLVQLLLTFPRRWACKLARTNVPISHHVENRLRLPRSRVIYYGIPDAHEPADRAATTDGAGGRSGPPVFSYVGRLVTEKGIPVLLQSAKVLVDAGYAFHVKIIGDGPERAKLEKMAHSLGLDGHVNFLGSLTGGPLRNELKTAAAVVMPSVWEETAGLVAIEQMMHRGLVIAADIGGLGEVVGEAGQKFAPGDVVGLAACLRRVLDDPGLAKFLADKGRERARELFSQERMVEDYLGVYHQIAGSFRRASLRSL